MKTPKNVMLLLVLLSWQSLSFGQSQFPIGIVAFGSHNTTQGLTQMDSLNISWVQALGQGSGNANDLSINNTVLQNTQNLNVIAIRNWNISLPAKTQRLEIQAELENDGGGQFDYFARTTQSTGGVAGNAWRALLGTHAAGFMARDLVPDDEYHYGRNNYFATFIMKATTTGVPTKQVATLSVVNESNGSTLASRILAEADFPDANYQGLELAYTLPQPPALPAKSFGKLLANTTGVTSSHNIDVRVYWHGLVTTWLDQVWLEDTMPQPPPNPTGNFNPWGAYQIFPRFGQTAGPRDNNIIGDADNFQSAATYPLVQRFYLADEPLTNGFLPYRYVDDLLQQANPDNLAQGRGRGITAYYYHQRAQRFLNDSQVRELFLDHYPIYANVPSPSILDDSKAAANGIAIYTDSPTYNTALQVALETLLTSLNDAATAAKNTSRTLWFIAQTHGILCEASGRYDTLSTKFLRPPTPNELRVMTNLALAYGAKGIFFYPYGSDSYFPAGFNGCKTARNIGLVSFQNPVNGYPRHNTNEETIGGHLVYTGHQEKWNAVRAINADLEILAPVLRNLKWKNAFTSGENPPSGSVVTSISGGSDVEIANFDSTGSDSYIMLVNRKCDLNDVQTVTVTTNKTGNWILDDQLADELFVSSNGVFKEVKLNPGQGRLFRVRAMTTNENWSGAVYVSNGITIASGSTLTIQLGATLKFSSAASLTINGKIVANSTNPTQRITFTGTTETPGFWNGIKINSGSSTNVSTLRRCDVQYATDGIKITYTGNSNNVTVDKCNIRNNDYNGIYINGNGYSGATVHPTIGNNFIIDNDATGIDLENYAKPTITGNRIENNYMGYGISAYSNSSATITYNFISGHALVSGIDLGYSSLAQLHRNTIRNNALDGVSMFFNSNVTAYGADTTKGRNDIRFNNDNGIYAYQSSPIFGKDVSNEWGNNWISDNAGYQAYQNYAGYLVRAERCYWGGQQSDVFGNVDVSPYLTSAPSPVGWGQSDTYDPTYLQPSKPGTMTELPRAETTHNLMTSVVAAGTNGSPMNWSEDLKAAIDEGLTTGDWSRASELITGLHHELQDARVPNVDFTLVADYADNREVASFVRKMLALVLMEKDLVENRIATALAKLTAFGQNNAEHKAELLANAGLIHLYRQNDFAAAQNVLAQLQTMAQNGDASAEEHVKLFGRIIENYQRHRSELSTELGKPIAAPPQTPTPPTTPALAQNYPNPFNPTTIIRFHLDERQKVRLVIYDLAGHRVRTLVEGELSPGEQAVSWDGRDHDGKTVASGVYFYELVIGNKSERKKMTLIR